MLKRRIVLAYLPCARVSKARHVVWQFARAFFSPLLENNSDLESVRAPHAGWLESEAVSIRYSGCSLLGQLRALTIYYSVIGMRYTKHLHPIKRFSFTRTASRDGRFSFVFRIVFEPIRWCFHLSGTSLRWAGCMCDQ